MSNTELATVEKKKVPLTTGNRGLQFGNLAEMWRFCEAVVNSQQFGKEVNTPEVALIRLQAGLEIGLTPIWSLTNIFVVNGKPTVYGDALLGIVRAHPQFADIRETIQGEGDDMIAICEVDRKGQSTTARRFGVRDAKKAGLWGKTGPWSSYPQRMLQMRARSWACRDAFADALRGLGVSEEVRDIEPRSIQAREIEKPKLILPDEEDLPAPAPDATAPDRLPNRVPEGDEVGDLMPSAKAGVVQDSGGGQSSPAGGEEVFNAETGEFEWKV